jgi:hypothetical protein
MNALQKYVIAKAKILKPFGEYVNKEDIAELGTWEPAIVEKISTRMRTVLSDIFSNNRAFDTKDRIRDYSSILSGPLCPWCHFNNDPEYEEFTEQDPSDIVMDCNDCSYACRHLRCSRSDSNWDTIHNAVFTAIVRKNPDVPTRKDIKRLYGMLKPRRKV